MGRKNNRRNVQISNSNSGNSSSGQSVEIKLEDMIFTHIKPIGFKNNGNTCFYNSVLQCLCQTNYLHEVLDQETRKHLDKQSRKITPYIDDKIDGDKPNHPSLSYPVPTLSETMECTKELLKRIHARSSGEDGEGCGDQGGARKKKNTRANAIINPESLYNMICSKNQRFILYQQDDCLAFFDAWLQLCNEEDRKAQVKAILEKLDVYRKNASEVSEEMIAKVKYYAKFIENHHVTPLERIFSGKYINYLHCQTCHMMKRTEERFNCLALSVNYNNSVNNKVAFLNKKNNTVQPKTIDASELRNINKKNTVETPPRSKYQEKKAKKAAKRENKYKKRHIRYSQNNISLKNGEEEEKTSEQQNEKPSDEPQDNKKENDIDDQQQQQDIEDSSMLPPEDDIKDEITDDDIKDETHEDDIKDELTNDDVPVEIMNKHECTDQLDGNIQMETLVPAGEFSVCVTESEEVEQNIAGEKEESENVEEKVQLDSQHELENLNDKSSIDSEIKTIINENGEKITDFTKNTATDDLTDLENLIGDLNIAKEKEPEFKLKGGNNDIIQPSNDHQSDDTSHNNIKNNDNNDEKEENGVDDENDKNEEKKVDTGNKKKNKRNKNSGPRLTENQYKPNGPSAKIFKAQYQKELPSTLSPTYEGRTGECSIEASLQHFTQIEYLVGDNQATCDSCTEKFKHKNNNNTDGDEKVKDVRRDQCKQILLSKPPNVLVLQLKIFAVTGRGRSRKVSQHVEIPPILDISPYCAPQAQEYLNEDGKIMYELFGIINHDGSLDSGHYTCYVKRRATCDTCQEDDKEPDDVTKTKRHKDPTKLGQWYNISDEIVRPVSRSQALNSKAYVVFYERLT